ncbi:MAG: hypothetical protein COB08_010570 [Rhodobacteraceae bacterium]|nr:hypothetical protein [Paracoccaceae bacterium]
MIGAAVLATGLGNGAQAQFLTAAEVKPILEMTQDSWVAVRVFDGKDLFYFTHLVVFRCGLEDVFYGLNGEVPNLRLPMEPCYEGTSAPAAMDAVKFPPYMTFPVGSIHSVTLMMMYDDGDIQEVSWERAQIQIQ